jgi:hypothetical protein
MTVTSNKAALRVAAFFVSIEIGTIAGIWAGQISHDVKVASAISLLAAGTISAVSRINGQLAIKAVKGRLSTISRMSATTFTCIALSGQAMSATWAAAICVAYWTLLLLAQTLRDQRSGETDGLPFMATIGPIMLIVSFGLAAGHTVIDSVAGVLGSVAFVLAGATGASLAGLGPEARRQTDTDRRGEASLAHNILFAAGYTILLIASWRLDFLGWVEGSAFHWSYFTGPASEYQANSWHTVANQYSPLATFISGRIAENTWRGIYITQAVLYSMTVIAIGLCTWRRGLMSGTAGLCLCYLLLFSDPGAVGPQAFPSSGLMRFFPVYLYSATFVLANRITGDWIRDSISECRSSKILQWRAGELIALCVGFSWSAESWLALTAAFAGYTAIVATRRIAQIPKVMTAKLSGRPRQNGLRLAVLKEATRYSRQSIYSYGIVAGLWLVGFVAIGGTSSYPLSYMAKRYGWVEPQGWITLSVVICSCACLHIVTMKTDSITLRPVFLLAGIAMTTGYVSYRPVSNNITAALPALVILSFSFGYLRKKSSLSGQTVENAFTNALNGFVVASVSALLALQIFGIGRLAEQTRKNANKQIDMTEKACIDGDRDLEGLVRRLGIDIDELRTGASKLVILDSNGYSQYTGLCHRFNGRAYHPLILQPLQLYLDPLEPEVASDRIRRILEAKKIGVIHMVIRIDSTSRVLMTSAIDRIPKEWILTNRQQLVKSGQVFKSFTFEKTKT